MPTLNRWISAVKMRRARQNARWDQYTDPVALCADHFRLRSTPDHVNYTSIQDTLALMAGRPQTILETGMSAWGTDSTRLFDAYIRSFGGMFWSVDIEPHHVDRLRDRVSSATTLVCDDSARFLRRWVEEHPDTHPDLVYLDSWDVDFADPLPAAEHCMREVRAIEPALRPGALLLIDDTPSAASYIPVEARDKATAIFDEYGAWPGKGMLADHYLTERGATRVHHRYQALYRI